MTAASLVTAIDRLVGAHHQSQLCVTPEAAAQLLDTKWNNWRRGALRAVMDFYIPYRLFRVAATMRGKV